MTAAEALRRYHAAEMRLAEVERMIEAHEAYRDMVDDPEYDPFSRRQPPRPSGDLQSLYIERQRLQAESFRVFTESRRD